MSPEKKAQKRKKVIGNSIVCFVLILIVGGLWIKSMQRSDTWNDVSQRQKIVIGLDDTYVPMGFRDAQGNLTGYDVELAQAAFKKLGLTPEFQVIDWSMKETELVTQHIDVIWNGYTKNAERASKVAFTDTYHQTQQVLLVRNGDIKSVTEMTDKQLGVQSGSAGLTIFNEEPDVLKNQLKAAPIQYDTFDKAINDLQVGRLDAVLIDADYAKYYLATEKFQIALTTIPTAYSKDAYGVGVRKEDKILREKLNDVLAELKSDGTEARLTKKYFG
jgi:polar amino acid transport system substrate-binding protein